MQCKPGIVTMETLLRILVAAMIPATSLTLRADISWTRHTIDKASPSEGRTGADGVRLADLDGDGRLDVVTAWENGGAIRVCRNPGSTYADRPWQGVTAGNVSGAEDAVLADIDDDGRLDVATSAEGKTRSMFVHWGPRDGKHLWESDAWTTAAIPSTEGKQAWMFSLPLDVDRNGRCDLITGAKGENGAVGWMRHPGPIAARSLDEWKWSALTTAGWIMSLIAVDLNQDGKTDVVFSDRKGPRSGIYWMRALPAEPWFAEPVRIGGGGEEVMFLDVFDFDEDGRLDVVAAIRPYTIRTILQPNDTDWKDWPDIVDLDPLPAERFGTVKAVRMGDVDLDGIPDYVISCENANGEKSGVLYANVHSEFTSVSGPEGVKFDRIELIDLDLDGDLDILTCEEKDDLGVFWYENPAR